MLLLKFRDGKDISDYFLVRNPYFYKRGTSLGMLII